MRVRTSAACCHHEYGILAAAAAGVYHLGYPCTVVLDSLLQKPPSEVVLHEICIRSLLHMARS
jgi:hypothetical protein